jgi:hypothetical protein
LYSLLFRAGSNGPLFYICLQTMMRQMEQTGDLNLSSYSRHLATQGVSLSSPDYYICLHDTLALILDYGYTLI